VRVYVAGRRNDDLLILAWPAGLSACLPAAGLRWHRKALFILAADWSAIIVPAAVDEA